MVSSNYSNSIIICLYSYMVSSNYSNSIIIICLYSYMVSSNYSNLIIIICLYSYMVSSNYSNLIIIICLYSCMVSSKYSNLIVIICLHMVIWFQAFLSNINTFQTNLFEPSLWHYEVLPLQIGVDLGVMAVKGYNTFSRSSCNLMTYLERLECIFCGGVLVV